MVSGMDIITASPAYVPAAAPEMNATADSPGRPKCTNIGLIHVAIHASMPKCCISVTANDMGIISFNSHLVLFHDAGTACLKQSKIFSMLLFANPQLEFPLKHNLHYSLYAVIGRSEAKGEMPHGASEVYLHAGVKEKTVVVLAIYHHHVDAESSLVA